MADVLPFCILNQYQISMKRGVDVIHLLCKVRISNYRALRLWKTFLFVDCIVIVLKHLFRCVYANQVSFGWQLLRLRIADFFSIRLNHVIGENMIFGGLNQTSFVLRIELNILNTMLTEFSFGYSSGRKLKRMSTLWYSPFSNAWLVKMKLEAFCI